MAEKILIVHGYSDGSTSFDGLRDFFIEQGRYRKENVFLVDYASMDDQSDFSDFADKLDGDYNRFFNGERIDVACHSTGALIVRCWLAFRRKKQIRQGAVKDSPIEHLLMFAPANFGSDLAKLGQSFLGKFRCTFFNSHSNKEDFLESGKKVLEGLEPASPFQWDLSMEDLHAFDYFSENPENGQICFPFVLAAADAYPGFESQLIKARNKPGTDGTVRICGTSLNTRKCTIRFQNHSPSGTIEWQKKTKFGHIPFGVFKGFNHGTIIDPEHDGFMSEGGPGNLALRALGVKTPDEYKQLATTFSYVTDKSFRNLSGDRSRRFQQIFFRVFDDAGFFVEDFYIDFFVIDSTGKVDSDLTIRFENQFKSDFYTHSVNRSCRALMMDCSDLKQFLKDLTTWKKRLVFDITARSNLKNIRYRTGRCVVFDPEKRKKETPEYEFLFENTTTLVEIRLNRIQSAKVLQVKDHLFRPIGPAEAPDKDFREQLSGKAVLKKYGERT